MTLVEFARPFQLSKKVTDANIRKADGTYVYVPLVKDFEIPTQIGEIVVESAKLEVFDGGVGAVLIINEPDEDAEPSEELIDKLADKLLDENKEAMEVLAQ